MADSPIITIDAVGKAYRIWESPSSRLIAPMLESISRAFPAGSGITRRLQADAQGRYHDFWALRDISFQISQGECIGIIGRNGSGKSTLLQIIAGTLQPTSGAAKVRGRVAALLELGSGFNPDFTGRENVYLNAAVLGLARREVDARFDQIAAFAEIGDFIDQPVKTYSSGMMVRLAFAVQTAVEPDILIIDEALSVGDFFFQQKCAARMSELRKRGTTILFVSHDLASVRDLCSRTLYLQKGKVAYWGETQEAISRYYQEGSPERQAAAKAPAPLPAPLPGQVVRFSREQALWWNEAAPASDQPAAHLLGVSLLDENGSPLSRFRMGQVARIQILFKAGAEGLYHAAIEVKNRHDQVITSVSSYTCGLAPQALPAGETAILELGIQLNIEAGRYSCQATLASDCAQPNRGIRLHSSPWLGPFDVIWDYENERSPFLGMFGPPTTATFIRLPNSYAKF